MSTNAAKPSGKSEGTSMEFKLLLFIIASGIVAVIIKMII